MPAPGSRTGLIMPLQLYVTKTFRTEFPMPTFRYKSPIFLDLDKKLSGFCPTGDSSSRSSAPLAALDDPGGHMAGRAGSGHRDCRMGHSNPDAEDHGAVRGECSHVLPRKTARQADTSVALLIPALLSGNFHMPEYAAPYRIRQNGKQSPRIRVGGEPEQAGSGERPAPTMQATDAVPISTLNLDHRFRSREPNG